MDLNVLPLFSSPLLICKIEEDFSNLSEKIKKLQYIPTDNECKNSSISVKKNLFDDFPREREVLDSIFTEFKNQVLKLKTTQFVMFSSWATKLGHGGYALLHNHTNSYYSGILYLDDYYEGGSLKFVNTFTTSHFSLNNPEERNILNSASWEISPKKNKLIMFPSYLFHSVKRNETTTDRYSIAFNWHPDGRIGSHDSEINLSVVI